MWYLFLNSSGWWWLTSSIFLTRTACSKTTHANGYWPGWAVSVSVLPLTNDQFNKKQGSSSGDSRCRETLGTSRLTLHYAIKADG